MGDFRKYPTRVVRDPKMSKLNKIHQLCTNKPS